MTTRKKDATPIGQGPCPQGCGSTIQIYRSAANHLYTRCPLCKCDQRNSPRVQSVMWAAGGFGPEVDPPRNLPHDWREIAGLDPIGQGGGTPEPETDPIGSPPAPENPETPPIGHVDPIGPADTEKPQPKKQGKPWLVLMALGGLLAAAVGIAAT